MFTSTIRMGKKCDLTEFNHGMIVGTRQCGLSIPETTDLLGFGSPRRIARLVKADRKVIVTQISTHYNSGMQKIISSLTTCQNYKSAEDLIILKK